MILLIGLLLTALTFADGKGHCVMLGDCAVDDDTGLTQPCVYDGNAVPLHDTGAIDYLKATCPDLDTGPDFAVCCSTSQVNTFQTQLNTLAALFKRCPSCYHNIANIFCQLVCSPSQSEFLKVTNSSSFKTKQSVTEMDYYLTESFAQGLFNSCKNVQMSFTSNPAVGIMCGGHLTDCNAHYWLEYMGGHDPSPYQINFRLEKTDNITVNGTVFHPMNKTIIPCSQAVGPGGSACSCVDCPCNPEPPPEPNHDHRELFGLPLLTAVMIIIYLIVALIIIGGFLWSSCSQKKHDDERLICDEEVLKKSETFCESWGAKMDTWLKDVFTQWGVFCATNAVLILLTGLAVFVMFASGLVFFTVRTNPVELWSAPNSQAREEKDYFDNHFGPFYRTEQVIITRKTNTPVIADNLTFSSVFDRRFLHQILELQNSITSLTAVRNNRTIHFEDICFAPVTKHKCLIQSAVNWFQNDPAHLDYYKSTKDYLEFLNNCTSNPFFIQKKGLSCLGEYGGPVFPYVALGGVADKHYNNASALILSFMVQNYVKAEDNADAIAWEKRFIEFLKNFSNPDMEFTFSAERSIQDELDRESQSDEATILISYMVMFAYVSITLGQYHSPGLICVKSKMLLGLTGVLIVLASVISSLGIFSYFGVPATLIIIEVIPFLVLAVGVDNIFIMVQAYQRSKRRAFETREQHIGRIVGQVAPSILVASLAESSCFFLGALSHMPAVHVFAFYSGLALVIDFLLQISCFVAVMSLDAAREETNRVDICCCIKIDHPETVPERKGCLHKLFDEYYAPFLMKDTVRCLVLLVFSAWVCLSISVLGGINVGLDQKLAMPKDSYVLKYFSSLEEYLSVGPPVYFVVKSGFNYSDVEDQSSLCSVAYCYRDSMVTQISDASKFSNRTYIAHPPLDWLDNFISWANDQTGCCRIYPNGTFCPSSEKDPLCDPCKATNDSNYRPYPKTFNKFLLDFLNENPSADCPVAGHAGFANALEIKNGSVGATHYMTYHTILKTSDDFTNALRWARKIGKNITQTLHLFNVSDHEAEVFPYSVFYVFYEQYITIIHDAVRNIIISLVDIFIVSFLLMGLDFHSAMIIVFTIFMILQNLMGLMFFWDISLNAVSLVNLMMAAGISVEFCSHIIRSFAFNSEGSKVERAQSAVAHTGSSVLSGITLTKFGGIVVLAFSKSQIFQVFYFRMYLGIVLIGAAHGLIFLPVFLSIIGPPRKYKKSTVLKEKHNPKKKDEDENPDVAILT